MNIFEEMIINLDKFHYVPNLGFKAKRNQGTVLGGIFTLCLGFAILYYLGIEVNLMTEFKRAYERSGITEANMAEIGILNLDDMGALPFFGVHYKGK